MRSRAQHLFTVLFCLAALWTAVASTPASAQLTSLRTEMRDGTEVLVVDGEIRYAIRGGDMLIPWEQWQQLDKATFRTAFWLGGLIRYEFEGLTLAQESLMLQAFAIVEGITNVTFSEGMGPFDSGINIYSTNPNDCGSCECANNATVGASFFGVVNICNWQMDVILHELGHVLGLYHEQTRPDRDTYVIIHYENIEDDREHNYDIQDDGVYGPYDFESLMHYHDCAFVDDTICATCTDTCRAITVLPPNERYQNLIGNYNNYSDLDRLTLSLMYLQPDWRIVDGSYGGAFPDGSLLMPYPSLQDGLSDTPVGGTVWIQPGSYAELGTYDTAVIWRAPLGGVTVGP